MKLKYLIHYPDSNTIEAAWENADGSRAKCRSYAGNQMADLRVDLGTDATANKAIIDQCEASYTPPPPPTAEELAKEAQRAQDELDLAEVKAMPFINFLVTHKPAQIANRITNDLAADGTEAVMIKLAKALAVLAKDKFR